MSISSPVTPSAFISAQALDLVPSEVAKPGMVKPRMFLRGRPSASKAFAATISAWVESSPPDTPMHDALAVGHLHPLRQALHLDVEGLVAVEVEARGIVRHEREAVDACARGRRPRRPAGARTRRGGSDVSGWPAATAAALKVTVRMRSRRRRSTSTSATAIWLLQREALASGRAARPARGWSPGRPRRGRWCSRRARRPSRGRPPGSASTATRRAARGRRPCRRRRSTPRGCRGSARRRARRASTAASAVQKSSQISTWK